MFLTKVGYLCSIDNNFAFFAFLHGGRAGFLVTFGNGFATATVATVVVATMVGLGWATFEARTVAFTPTATGADPLGEASLPETKTSDKEKGANEHESMV